MRKNSKFIFIIVFLISMMIDNAYSQESLGKLNLPLSGKVADYLAKGDGVPGKKGDFIYFNLLIKGDDGSVITDRRSENLWINEELKDIDSTVFPLVEMLHYMVPGDSLRYEMELSEGQKPRGMENINSVVYFIKAEKLVDAETMAKIKAEEVKEQEAKLAQAKIVEGEVGVKVAGLLEKYKAGDLNKDIMTTDSGLEYVVLDKGTGDKVEANENVAVDYYGVFKADGRMFDNSFGRGQKLRFNAGVGQMIKGWDEAMLYLNHGDKAILFIPYNLAYGEAGRPPQIPEKSDLVFYIEVE
ncbi:MAG: FKBP-type peptidyl-prolyl cis-trans isomerase [Saprospiraceae bacterium]